jgi:vacuolar protein sorting-associated protein 45
VYTQHQPALMTTLDAVVKGKIKDSVFPPVTAGAAGAGGAAQQQAGAKPAEVLVFIVGGVTYEEATKVAEFNAANPTTRVILGGSCIHNSTSFLREINNSFGSR